MIATFPKFIPTESQQQFRFFCYLGFITFVKGGIFSGKVKVAIKTDDCKIELFSTATNGVT